MFGNQNIMLMEKTKNQTTKEKILIATINASIKKRKNPYSLCNIAMDVGISKPAIFKYFKCKESLIKAATAKAFDDIAAIYIQVKNQFENDVEKIIQYFSLWLFNNPSYLIFVLSQFMMERDFSSIIVSELESRGVKLKKDFLSKEGITEVYTISSIITLICCIFQEKNVENGESSKNQLTDKIQEFAAGISSCICYGVKESSYPTDINYDELDILCEAATYQFMKEQKENSSKAENLLKNEVRFFNALASVIKKYSFSGVTIEKLAEEAGLAKSSLYTWFKNKDELLEKVISARFLQLKNLLEHNIKIAKNPVEKSYVILKTETQWLLENISVLPVAAWLNFSGNGTINVGQIVLSESNWGNNLFTLEKLGLENSILPSCWLICLPIPIVLEGSCRNFSPDFMSDSVKLIHSMVWNGILYRNKEN